MKLLHSRTRALLSASRTVRRCTEVQYYTPFTSILPQQCHHPRTVTTTATPQPRPSPNTDANTRTSNDTPQISEQVRLLMRRVPYPVAIITSTDPSSTSPAKSTSTQHAAAAAAFRGMTVSSFNTVTLTPEPIISFNVRRPSETLNALLSSSRFLVHLLAPRKETAVLARDFARGNHALAAFLNGENAANGNGDGFEFVPFTPTPAAAGELPRPLLPLPLLRRKTKSRKESESDSESKFEPGSSSDFFFPFIFECRLLPRKSVDVYDHTVVVGTVVRAITGHLPLNDGVSSSSSSSPEDLCLTYADTRFWEMGREV